MGLVHLIQRELASASTFLEKALELNPSLAWLHFLLGRTLTNAGKAQQAIPHLRAAIQMSPRDAEVGPFHTGLAIAHFYLRQHEDAVDWARKAVSYPTVQWPAHTFLVAALNHLGREAEASEALSELMRLKPGITLSFVRDHLPAISSEYMDHHLGGLRKAGLPEE